MYVINEFETNYVISFWIRTLNAPLTKNLITIKQFEVTKPKPNAVSAHQP